MKTGRATPDGPRLPVPRSADPARCVPAEQHRHGAIPSTQHGTPRSPRRTCVGCRRTRPQQELIRVARTPDGVAVDLGRHLPGRGSYLCHDMSCIDAAARRAAGSMRRALRGAPEHEVSAALTALRPFVACDEPGSGTTTATPKE